MLHIKIWYCTPLLWGGKSFCLTGYDHITHLHHDNTHLLQHTRPDNVLACLITEAIVLSNTKAWGEIERVQLKHKKHPPNAPVQTRMQTHTLGLLIRLVSIWCCALCNTAVQTVHSWGTEPKKKDKHRGASLICYLKWRTVDIIAFYLVYINTLGTRITYGYNNVLIAHHFTDSIRFVSRT